MRILVIDSEKENDGTLERVQQALWRDIEWTRARTRHEAYQALFERSARDRPFENMLINWASHLGETAANSDHFVKWLASGAQGVQNVPVYSYCTTERFGEYLTTLPPEICAGVADLNDIPDLCRKLGLMVPPGYCHSFPERTLEGDLPFSFRTGLQPIAAEKIQALENFRARREAGRRPFW